MGSRDDTNGAGAAPSSCAFEDFECLRTQSQAPPTSAFAAPSIIGPPTTVATASPTGEENGRPTSAGLTKTVAQVTGSTGNVGAVETAAPNTASNASSKAGSSLSTGAIAGIAIAMLLVGGAIAFIVAFFMFKRRNRKQGANVNGGGYGNYADSTPELVMMQQKNNGLGGRNSPYVQVSQTPIPAPLPAPMPAPPVQQSNSDVTSFLPPAAQDNAIHSRVLVLFGNIHRHVETYYRDVHASITPSMEPELARFGSKDVNMAELLQECSSPTTAIKHALVAYVLGITGPKKEEDGETLFPEELNGVQIQHGAESTSDSNLTTASALHRRLSVYLYTSTHSISNPRRSWSFQSDIREAAEHFSLTFFPWANPTASDQEKDEDLARIISEALETRIWLFGQPDGFEFVWEGTGRRGILVSPGLISRTHEGESRTIVDGIVTGL